MKARLTLFASDPIKAEVLPHGGVTLIFEEDVNCVDEEVAINDPGGYKREMIWNHFEHDFEVVSDEEVSDA